jgi:hypothetical protein
VSICGLRDPVLFLIGCQVQLTECDVFMIILNGWLNFYLEYTVCDRPRVREGDGRVVQGHKVVLRTTQAHFS